MLRRRVDLKRCAAALVLALTTAVTVVATATGASGAGGGTIVLSTLSDWTDFDFQKAALLGNTDMTAVSYDGMVAWSKDPKQGIPSGAHLVPYLAASWRVTPTSVTFKLRKGPHCWDGTPITPAVVKRSWDRMLQVSSSLGVSFGGTQGDPSTGVAPTGIGPFAVSADEKAGTVTFRSGKPSNELITGFNSTYALNGATGRVVCPAGLANPDNLKTGMYGSGPYQLVSAEHLNQVVLRLWPEWTWGPNGATAKAPDLPKTLIFRIIPNTTTMVNEALSGNIDVIRSAGLSPSDTQRVETSQQFQTFRSRPLGLGTPVAGAVVVFFNNSRPTFQDIWLRTALSNVIDPKLWMQANGYKVGIDGVPTTSVVTQGRPCYDAGTKKYFKTTSIDDARQLLLQHGYTYRAGQLFKPDGSKLAFELIFPGLYAGSGQYVYSQWQKLGVDVTVRTFPEFTGYGVKVTQADFDAANGGGIPSMGWYSGAYYPQGQNLGGPQNNVAYESAIAHALAAVPFAGATSCKYWSQVQDMIARNHWLLPIYTNFGTLYVRKGITVSSWGGSLSGDTFSLATVAMRVPKALHS
jgi:peptide/nickel transport system substrate-binding protein